MDEREELDKKKKSNNLVNIFFIGFRKEEKKVAECFGVYDGMVL